MILETTLRITVISSFLLLVSKSWSYTPVYEMAVCPVELNPGIVEHIFSVYLKLMLSLSKIYQEPRMVSYLNYNFWFICFYLLDLTDFVLN